MAEASPGLGRWLARVMTVVLGLLGGALAVALLAVLVVVLFLVTPSGHAFLANQAVERANDFLAEGELTVAGLRTDVLSFVELEGVRLDGADGEPIVQLGQLVVRYDLKPLLDKRVRLTDVELSGARLDLLTSDAGELELLRVLGLDGPAEEPPSDEPWSGLGVDLDVERIAVEGLSVVYGTEDAEAVRLVGASVDGVLQARGARLDLSQLVVAGHLATPGPLPLAATGAVSYDAEGLGIEALRVQVPGSDLTVAGSVGEALELGVTVASLDLARLDPVAGSPGIAGVLQGSVELDGPLEALVVSGELAGREPTRGRVGLAGTLDVASTPMVFQLESSVQGLHVADLYPSLGEDDPLVLDGQLVADVTGTAWPSDLVVDATYSGGQQDIYGQQLDGVELAIRLENGVLSIRPTSVRGILGVLEASGDIELVDGPMSVRVQGTIEPARLEALGVAGVRSTGRLDATIRGDLTDPSAPLRIKGTIDYPRFRYGSDVVLDGVEAIVDVRVAGSDVRGDVRLTTWDGMAYGVSLSGSGTPDLTFHVSPDGRVVASGTTSFGPLGLPDTLQLDGGSAGWAVTVPSGGSPRVEASVELDPLSLVDFPSSGGHVGVELEGDALDLDVRLAGQTGPLLELDGRFDTRRSRLEARRVLLGPTPRGSWVGEDLRLTLAESGITDAHIDLRGNLGDVRVDGRVGLEGPQSADIAVAGLQLDIASEWFPELVEGLSGSLDLDAHVGGTADALEVDATVDLDGLWYADQARWVDITGTVTAREGAVAPALTIAAHDEPLVSVEGKIPVVLDLQDLRPEPSGAVDLIVAVLPGGLERIERVAPAAGDLPSGEVSAALRLDGVLRDPSVELAGVMGVEVDRWADPVRVEMDVRREGGDVEGWLDIRQGFEELGALTLQGDTRVSEVISWALEGGEEPDFEDYSLFLDAMDVRAELDGLSLASIGTALGSSLRIAGAAHGDVTVTGSPLSPVMTVDVDVDDCELGTTLMDDVSLVLTPSSAGYFLDLDLEFTEGDFHVTGDVPLVPDLRTETEGWVRGDLDLELTGEGLPLTLVGLVDEGVRDAEGQIKLSGHVGGSPLDPSPDVTLSIDGGALVYSPQGLRVSDLVVDAQATRDRIGWSVRAHTEPTRILAEIERDRSIIELKGEAALDEWMPGEITARLDLLQGAFVSGLPSQRLRMDGGVDISGTWPALSVSGDLALVNGRFFMDSASFLSKAPLSLDPSMVLKRRSTGSLHDEEDGPALYESFIVDLDIDLGRNLDFKMLMPFLDTYGAFSAMVSTVDMDSRLGGTIHVALENGDPALVGEVEIVDGTVSVLRSRFDLRNSKIIFTGANYTEPILNIAARMSVTGAAVDMTIDGTPSDPAIDFSSEEYPDKSQILTILLTGRAPDELDAEDGQGTATALAGMLLNSLFGGLGSFSIQPDGSVRAGIPVSQTVHATTMVNPAPQQDENGLTLELEWSILPRLVASGAFGVPNSWGDLYWEFRF